MIVDVFPDTLALNVTVCPHVGFVLLAVTVTAGGCPGRMLTPVETVSAQPAASLAVARTVKVPSSRYV
jgi:hypothetical protein